MSPGVCCSCCSTLAHIINVSPEPELLYSSNSWLCTPSNHFTALFCSRSFQSWIARLSPFNIINSTNLNHKFHRVAEEQWVDLESISAHTISCTSRGITSFIISSFMNFGRDTLVNADDVVDTYGIMIIIIILQHQQPKRLRHGYASSVVSSYFNRYFRSNVMSPDHIPLRSFDLTDQHLHTIPRML